MTRKPEPAGFEVGTIAPRELTSIERAAFGIFDTTPAGVQRNNRSEWRPVTEREAPESAPLDFVLTPRERDVATMAALHLENRRRRLNELDEAQPDHCGGHKRHVWGCRPCEEAAGKFNEPTEAQPFIVREPRQGGEL